MDQPTMIAVVVGVLVLALLSWYVRQRQRSVALRSRHGSEFERTIVQVGDERGAVSELLKRQERVAQLDILPLSADQRNGFVQQWRAVQTRFVDDPRGAVTEAGRLVEELMRARGYPVADFDQRADDLSLRHSRVVANYRAARDIARRHRRGETTTDDFRQAMVHYRGLFEDVLENRETEGWNGAAPRSARAEREIERSTERDDDRREIPVKRAGERLGDRELRDDRDVRP